MENIPHEVVERTNKAEDERDIEKLIMLAKVYKEDFHSLNYISDAIATVQNITRFKVDDFINNYHVPCPHSERRFKN